MGFPLKAWIDDHPGVGHHLAQSGMRGQLRSAERALRRPAQPDPAALHREVARLVGVPPARTFLTHGATEGMSTVVGYLRGRRRGRVTFRVPSPDYPPFRDVATGLGMVEASRVANVTLCSDPNNPTGLGRTGREWSALARATQDLVVDETFREFSPRASRARAARPREWVVGTFTKVYGGDSVRVGWVVAPPADADGFGTLHGVAVNEIPPASVGLARSLIGARAAILAEARALFQRNLATLRARVRGVPDLAAPVWFDRGRGGISGDRFARALLDADVLVCPGRFFGDPTGVRLTLTQRTFPADLEAYLRVRQRWI